LKGQFATGFFDDTGTPAFESIQTNTAGPGGLNFPRCGFRRGSITNKRCTQNGGTTHRCSRFQKFAASIAIRI